VCNPGYVYVPLTNTCAKQEECDDSSGWQLDPATNKCVFVGITGVSDIFYIPDTAENAYNACPSGFTPFASHVDLNKKSLGAYIYGCKKVQRNKGNVGLLDFVLTQKDCPAGWTKDPTNLNARAPFAKSLYSCKRFGDVTSPSYIRDIDAVDVEAGGSCASKGAGWSDSSWDFNWGVPSWGHRVNACLKR
jgi:hypothetical protein